MARPSFEEAVRLAKQYRELAEAGWPGAAESYRRAPPGIGLHQLLLRSWIGRSDEREAWDALSFVAQHLLRTGEPLPDELRLWVADALAKPRPKRKRGRPVNNQSRDAAIVQVVKMLVAVGYRPTRSPACVDNRGGDSTKACKAGASACDVAGVAFGRSDDEPLGYKVVEQVWLRFRTWEKDVSEAELEWLGWNLLPGNKS